VLPLKNREDAGEKLRRLVLDTEDSFDVFLGINEGGVVVGEKIARAFNRQINLVKVKNFGLPSAPTLDLGAVTDEGTLSINPEVESAVTVKPDYVAEVADKKRFEARKCYSKYCKGLKRPSLKKREVFIVGDGSQSISALTAVVGYAKKSGASKICLGTSFLSHQDMELLSKLTDSVVAIESSNSFGSVDDFYRELRPLDKEIMSDILVQ